MHSFRLFGLPAKSFAHLAGLSAEELANRGVRRVRADDKPGYPCRVSLVDAEVGEELFLLSHVHHAVESPYRASGPIFVRVHARERLLEAGEVPECVQSRLMSVRAYDAQNCLVGAEVCEGPWVPQALDGFFAQAKVQYVHLHNAKPGCFSCEARRWVLPRSTAHGSSR
jgi:hypothetical protein